MSPSVIRLLRTCLSASLFVLAACGGASGGGSDNRASAQKFYPAGTTVPVTGPDVSGAAPFDELMTRLMKDNDVPGATLAIAKGGRLVMAKGYGYADFESRQLMQPDAMFRIASVSKVLTSMTALQLKDQGLLRLDDKVLDILTEVPLPPSGDARLRDITVRHLLQHAGGWDRSISPDPSTQEMTRALGISPPLTTADRIRYALTRPLDFTPGTKYHYSNFGYCMLGPIIEKVGGRRYELYVRDNVLLPMGVFAMSIGKSVVNGRGPYEVKYYDQAGAAATENPDDGGLAFCPASGSWIGSTIDLTRVMTAIEGSRGGAFLSAATMQEYLADPMLPPQVANQWWGLGIAVGPTPDAWSHGGLGNSVALLQRTSSYTWAVLTNFWPSDANAFAGQIHAAVTAALASGIDGPLDLYSQFPSPNLPPSEP
jgi:CubicO group peptidase (beta-lactamase class C family)